MQLSSGLGSFLIIKLRGSTFSVQESILQLLCGISELPLSLLLGFVTVIM
jgi:hypothetical protein